jgi:2-oxoisovalerate dehydrogenase E1 component
MPSPTAPILADLHRRMVRIRHFEENCGRLSEEGKLPGFLHLYVGEEAVAAGVCAALTDQDRITSTHRGHGHLIAKGGDFKRAYAELFGRSTGYCGGKGGSMHISDMDLGMLGANGIVGAGVPIAAGAGFASNYTNDGTIAVAFFGDGASNIGAFHEGINMAAALKLPVVFVCENNEFGEYTPRDKTMAITDIATRAEGYGMPGVVVDGMDAVAVWEVATEAVARARRGDGPSMIEAKTYRYYDHHGVVGLRVKYREESEVEAWKARDAIDHLEGSMAAAGIQSLEQSRAVQDEIAAEIEEALAFAEASPMPEVSTLADDLYTPRSVAPAPPPPGGDRKLSYVQAASETIRQLMSEDDTVFLAGEDVGGYGGAFRNFAGLYDEFGERRVVDTPISEQAIIGLGIGASVSGLKPIVDIMFMDFIAVAMDQIMNQAAKLKYMFGGNAVLQMTITTFGGAGLSGAAQHSQSLEAFLCHIPGLKVVAPSTAYDMKGLLAAAVREPNPTIVVGNKLLLGVSDMVPEELYEVPLGVADIKRTGSDVTLVSYGRMLHECLAAADLLAADGIDCEVIDPRTLQPFDTETVANSVRKTNRAIVVHEAVRFGGFGAEIAAQIQEEAFDYLDAPVGRIGAPFSPVPFSPALEAAYIPDRTSIAAEVRAMMGV